MNSRLITLGLLSFALLAACTPEQQNTIDSMMEDKDDAAMMGDDSMMKDDTMMDDDSMMKDEDEMEGGQHRTSYSNYAPSVLVDGQTKVLFFHAAWCPVCRKADDTLRGIYNQWDESDMSFDELRALLPQYSVYKVDYDTEADLKAKYGVTYQHTFVLVDGQGNALKTIQGPSDAVLKELIGAKS